MKNDRMIVDTIRIKPTKPMIWPPLINANSRLGIVSFALKYLLSQIVNQGFKSLPDRHILQVRDF
jgi:hypothetical protein